MMDTEKIGRFIAALRRSSGLTQQSVADALGLSDKTISKWENGNGLPDISILPALAELFGVTTDEILRGERILDAANAGQSEKKTAEQARFFIQNKYRRIQGMLILSTGITLCALILLYVVLQIAYPTSLSGGISLILCVAGGIVLFNALGAIKEARLSALVAQYQKGSTQTANLGTFAQAALFLLLYVAGLNLSLLIGEGRLAWWSLLHHIVGLVIAGIGVLIYKIYNRTNRED